MKHCWLSIMFGSLLLVNPASAQSPVPDPGSACDVNPKAQTALEHLIKHATPQSGEELEPYIIADSALPSGKPADDTTVREITGVASERAACARDLDEARFYALYTDRYLSDLFSAEGHVEWTGSLGTPTDSPHVVADYQLGAVDLVTQLADGRVSAFVTYVGADAEDSYPRRGITYLMEFERLGGTWLIDRQYESYLESATQDVYPVAQLLESMATPVS